MNISTENTIMILENSLVAAWGEREEVGEIGILGLRNANYCSWNGFTLRSCCVALRTMSRYLHHNTTMGGKICLHVCVTWFPCYTAEKKINNNLKNYTVLSRVSYTVLRNECWLKHSDKKKSLVA